MNALAKIQFDYNASSRDAWESFRGHRQAVTRLLAPGPSAGGGRLCVLGAGNCNDVDLATLLAVYREVHLVDLDAGALAAGVARQGCAGHPAVRLHGGVELTGMLDVLAGWSPQTAIADADLAACRDRPPHDIGPALPGPFDLVGSVCLLSQLMLSALRAVGAQHPRFVDLLQAVRLGHLRLLTDLVAPGGTGVLITDVVSWQTFPPLGSVPPDRLAGLLAELIRRHNFFHGVNPAVLTATFRTDPALGPQVNRVESLRPWPWDFGTRVYAVWALRFRKKAARPRRPCMAPS